MYALEGEEESDNSEFALMNEDVCGIDGLLNATTQRDVEGQINGPSHGQDVAKFREAVDESTPIADDLSPLTVTANTPIFSLRADGKVTVRKEKV